jgi:hypothetical protein
MNYVATGGSKSDGTVKLSYEFGLFQEPVVNEQQGLELAKSKCAMWGYTGAEPFGGNCVIAPTTTKMVVFDTLLQPSINVLAGQQSKAFRGRPS